MRRTWEVSSWPPPFRLRKMESTALAAPLTERSCCQTFGFNRIVLVLPPFPNTVIWPPSWRGRASHHFKPHSSPARTPETYSNFRRTLSRPCLLYTSDAADEED